MRQIYGYGFVFTYRQYYNRIEWREKIKGERYYDLWAVIVFGVKLCLLLLLYLFLFCQEQKYIFFNKKVGYV